MPHTATNKEVYAGIYVDSKRVVRGVADSQHGFWDQTTIRAIVHLGAGQHVTLRNPDTAARRYYGYTYTTFSGFLVQADQ